MRGRFILALGIAVACAACSQQHESDVSSAATPPAAAASATSHAPVLATTSSSPGRLTYLYDLMQRPDFSTAFEALSGAD